MEGSRGLSSSGLRLLGVFLIAIGLLVVTMAFVPGGVEGEGVIIIFPFVFGNVGGGAGVILTLVFFALFILSFLLPWYTIQRRSALEGGFEALHRVRRPRRRSRETMEYIITTELPSELRRSVYVEADEDTIYLRSTEDEGFLRSYSLPEGFEVSEIDYSFEGSYLVLKLILKRVEGI